MHKSGTRCVGTPAVVRAKPRILVQYERCTRLVLAGVVGAKGRGCFTCGSTVGVGTAVVRAEYKVGVGGRAGAQGVAARVWTAMNQCTVFMRNRVEVLDALLAAGAVGHPSVARIVWIVLGQ